MEKWKQKWTTLFVAGSALFCVMLPIKKVSAIELIPDQNFSGRVGDHPILEAFGDVEGEGVLASTERDTGKPRVIPYSSMTTPNRQMAMKIGNFKYNTTTAYPADTWNVSTLVNEKAIEKDTATSKATWGGITMDTASVVVETDDGSRFYDIGGGSYDAKSLKLGSTRAASIYNNGKGISIAQAGSMDVDNFRYTNNQYYRWTFMETLPGGGTHVGSGNGLKSSTVLMKMYHSVDKPYSVGYGALVDKSSERARPLDLLGYVRVVMQPVGDEGRVRATYSFVNLTTNSEREYSALYASYGNQFNETRSRGNDIGEYFRYNALPDSKGGYGYSIYRDEYPALSENIPVRSPIGRVSGIPAAFEPGINPIDPGHGQSFSSPGYVWERQATPLGKVVSWDLDLQGYNINDVTTRYVLKSTGKDLVTPDVIPGLYDAKYETKPKEIPNYRFLKPLPENASGIYKGEPITVTYYYELTPTEGNIISHYVDLEGNTISNDDVVKMKIGAQFDVKPKNINNYVYVKAVGETTGEITEEDQEVTFVYMSLEMDAFKAKQEIFNSKNESVDGDKAKQGEEVSFSLTLNTDKEIQDLNYDYRSAVITEKIDTALEDVKEMELRDSAGEVAGTATYNKSAHQITATLTAKTLSTEKALKLTYKAKVKENAQIGSEILQKAQVAIAIQSGSLYTNVVNITSNETVTKVGSGKLEWISSPAKIDFGDNNTLSLTKKEIFPVNLTGDNQLIIQDQRDMGKGFGWTLSLKLEKEFEASVSGAKLANVLKYRKNGVDIPINTESQSVLSVESADNEPINLTNEWKEKKEGLLLEIPAGGTVLADQYQTNLIWTMNDTPEN